MLPTFELGSNISILMLDAILLFGDYIASILEGMEIAVSFHRVLIGRGRYGRPPASNQEAPMLHQPTATLDAQPRKPAADAGGLQ